MASKPEISIVIPVYNEQDVVAEVLEKTKNLLNQAGLTFEIIAVEDGSTDSSAERIGSVEGVTLVKHERNMGYGAALKSGIKNAKYDWICITDADGTYPIEAIQEIFNYALDNNLDMAVGARVGDNVHIPLARRPAKWVVGKLAGYVAERKIPDINSGLRVFRRDLAKQFMYLLPDGFSFTTTITLAMITKDYKVGYLPIAYQKRVGHSKIRPIPDTINFINLVLRIGLYFSPLKIFLPLSFFMFLLAVGWAVFTKLAFGKLADLSSLIIAMGALQVAVIGLLAELINKRLTGEGARPQDGSRG